MTIQTDLQTAVAKVTADSATLHQIVHGAATSTVTTEGGAVKTVAKALADLEALWEASDIISQVTALKDAALAAYDNFDDRYLGAKATLPSLDNDDNALQAGTLCLYTGGTIPTMMLWTGSVWSAAYVSAENGLLISNALSELASVAATARANLGLGAVATENILPPALGGTGAVAAPAARVNLGLGSAATLDAGAGAGNVVVIQTGGKLPALDGSDLTGLSASDPVARANILLNAFRLAVVGGLSVQAMADGVVDEFEDQTGVDDAASTGEIYNVDNDYYSAGAIPPSDFVPAMSAYTADGVTISASADNGDLAWKAFNDSQSSWWQSQIDPNSTPQWLKVDFGAGNSKVATKYTLTPAYDSSTGLAPGTWTFDGSNNDSTWTQLDAQSGILMPTVGIKREFTFSNATAYRYYRIRITARAYSYPAIAIGEMEIYGGAPPVAIDMVLISETFTALVQPNEAFIVMWQEDVNAITLNADLKAWASRDGGASWSQATLTEEAVLSTGRILTGSAALSGQPAGVAMRWKVTTHNTKVLRVHGIALQWSA